MIDTKVQRLNGIGATVITFPYRTERFAGIYLN